MWLRELSRTQSLFGGEMEWLAGRWTCTHSWGWHQGLPDPLHARPTILCLLESTLETLAFMGTFWVWRTAADSTAGLQRRPQLVHGYSSKCVEVQKLTKNNSLESCESIRIAASTVSRDPVSSTRNRHCSQALSQKQLQRSASKNDSVGRITKEQAFGREER
jgi:hypothetical protein